MLTLRTQAIGIRMALGARSGDVLWAVGGHGIALAAIGAAIGTTASFAVTRYMRNILFEVKSSDPVTLGEVAAILLCRSLRFAPEVMPSAKRRSFESSCVHRAL